MACHVSLIKEHWWSLLFAHPEGRHHTLGAKVCTWRLTSIFLLSPFIKQMWRVPTHVQDEEGGHKNV